MISDPIQLSIAFDENGIITVEGVKMSVQGVKQVIINPPIDVLFSVKREDNQLIFTRYSTAEAAAKFFDATSSR